MRQRAIQTNVGSATYNNGLTSRHVPCQPVKGSLVSWQRLLSFIVTHCQLQ